MLDGLDDVAAPGLSLASDKGGTLADPSESLSEVLGTADKGGVEGGLVDVVLWGRASVSMSARVVCGGSDATYDIVGHGQNLGLCRSSRCRQVSFVIVADGRQSLEIPINVDGMRQRRIGAFSTWKIIAG